MQIQLQLHINNNIHNLHVDPDRTLLSVLREELGVTGPKYGCGEGKCGACTVLMDGNPVQACSVTVGAAAGSRLTTVEGLAANGRLHPIQSAFLEIGALQCGYCTPGMLMSAAALLDAHPQPSLAEINHFMQDNVCRCGAYQRIVAAIQRAAAILQTGDAVNPVISTEVAVMRPFDTAEPVPTKNDEGIFVAYPCPDLVMARYGEDAEIPAPEERELQDIGPWVHIDGEGAITVCVGKAEVGQNIRTTLAQIVAEELRISADMVRVVLGDTGLTPFDMGTFGSRTTPVTGAQLWRVGATARELLLDLAAAAWSVARTTLQITGGVVSHPASGRSATFGDLARDRNLLRIAPDDAPITPPSAWTTAAGQPRAKVNGQAFVTGQHPYASDTALPAMYYGKVLRPPAYQAKLVSIDSSAAAAIAGVTVVQERHDEEDFVGVVGPDEFTASQALDAIRTRWQTPLQVSQPELFEYLKANPVEGEGRRGPYLAVEGSVEEGLAAAHFTLSQQYTVEYIAHAPLEPRAAVAQWQDGQLTVWTGTSRPFGVRTELALAFGLPETQIRVIVPDTGSGYGGKHTGQAAIEAARLAKAVGAPVKLVWTREEEFTWAYLRPAGIIEVTGGVDAEGRFTALQLLNTNSGAAGIETLYAIPNRHIAYQPADSPLPQGSYRSLAAPANHFARETFLDEIAHSLGIDPLEIRYRNLQDERMKAVLTAAADGFGWGKSTPAAHHGFGLAGGFDKNSYIATCAEVYVNPANGQVKVVRVVAAYDCGAIINPDTVRNQVEGALVQGLGGALFERITFANGRLLNANFGGYRVPRFGDIPTIEVVLLDRRDISPAGAGETPIVAIAPAIGNAIFQATGVRLRALPLAPHGVQR
ncbi:MAG: molybdopterin cofactor-binding domain-containing protein [Caldilineaceae bacterium]